MICSDDGLMRNPATFGRSLWEVGDTAIVENRRVTYLGFDGLFRVWKVDKPVPLG